MSRRSGLSNTCCRRVILWLLVAVLAMPNGFAPASVEAAPSGAVFALTDTPSGNVVASSSAPRTAS